MHAVVHLEPSAHSPRLAPSQRECALAERDMRFCILLQRVHGQGQRDWLGRQEAQGRQMLETYGRFAGAQDMISATLVDKLNQARGIR